MSKLIIEAEWVDVSDEVSELVCGDKHVLAVVAYSWVDGWWHSSAGTWLIAEPTKEECQARVEELLKAKPKEEK